MSSVAMYSVGFIDSFQMPAVPSVGPLYFYAVMFQSGYLDLDHLASSGSVYQFYLQP